MTGADEIAFTDAERLKIRLAHSKRLSAGHVAAELGRPVEAVKACAAEMDLYFSRADAAAAMDAAIEGMEERRALLAERFLREASDALDAMRQPYMAWDFSSFGEGPARFSQHLVMPGPAERANLMRAAQMAVAEHARLLELDAKLELIRQGGTAGAAQGAPNAAVIAALADRLHAIGAGHQVVAGEVIQAPEEAASPQPAGDTS